MRGEQQQSIALDPLRTPRDRHGLEGENVVLQDIFLFQAVAVSEIDKVEGTLKPTGIRPNFSPRLEKAGFRLSGEIFGAGSMPMMQGKRK